MSAYCEALRRWGLPSLDARMSAVGGLVGILVVTPEQLLPLINGTLRLDHRYGGGREKLGNVVVHACVCRSCRMGTAGAGGVGSLSLVRSQWD